MNKKVMNEKAIAYWLRSITDRITGGITGGIHRQATILTNSNYETKRCSFIVCILNHYTILPLPKEKNNISRNKPEYYGHSYQTVKTKQNKTQKLRFERPRTRTLRHRSVTPWSCYSNESPSFRILEGVFMGIWNPGLVFQKAKRITIHL